MKFRKLAPDEIRKYFIREFDKAGAYSIQDRGEMLIDEINGSYSNIIGLPIPTTLNLLRKFNINVFKHFFIYIQNHLIYFKTKNNKVTSFHYLNKLYFSDLSIVIGCIKKYK